MRSAEGIARPVKKCDRVGSECGERGVGVKFQEYRTHLRSQEEAASRLSISRTKQRLILVVA
jgi:hypothetical protein